MPCESCAVQFSVFKRKRACPECERYYCGTCLRRGGGAMCVPCRVLSTRPLSRPAMAHLKVRDLQCFLQRQNVSTRGCVEKEDLVSLVLAHVNSAAYRRRAPRPRSPSGPFSSFKGFTSNINELINSAFDLRPPQPTQAHDVPVATPPPAPPRPPAAPQANAAPATDPSPARAMPPAAHHATSNAGSQADEEPSQASEEGSSPQSPQQPLIDTADCFEIEDVEDSDWEFVRRVLRPLPHDSEMLLTAEAGGTPHRAASELDLPRAGATDAGSDTTSLKDEAGVGGAPSARAERQVRLERLAAADLEALSVRQLKELLALNRVDYRGCLERDDLLRRAKMLWEENARYGEDADKLPLEECCKICMAAPLECVLLECGHIAACTACSKQLAECPICRQYVVRAVRFFRS